MKAIEWRSGVSFHTVFVYGLLLVCLAVSLITPPLQSPDETAHIARAYAVSRGQVTMETPQGGSSGGQVDSALLKYIDTYTKLAGKPRTTLSVSELQQATQLKWSSEEEFSKFPGTGYYFPLVYAPQAVALFASRALDLTIAQSYSLTRWVTLLVSLSILVWAARITKLPAILWAVIALPMSVFQLASTSIDGFVTSVMVLALAIFCRLLKKEPQSNRFYTGLLAASIFLLGTSRLHAAPLVLLFAVLYYYDRRKIFVYFGFAVTAGILLWNYYAALMTTGQNQSGAPLSQVAGYYLSHPSRFFSNIVHTLEDKPMRDGYWASFIGVLGWLDTHLPLLAYRILPAGLGLIAVLSGISAWSRNGSVVRFSAIVMAACSVLIIFLAMLLTWTPHPAESIIGVQGRYFIVSAVILSLIFFPFGSTQRVWADAFGKLAALGILLVSSYFTLTGLLARFPYQDHSATWGTVRTAASAAATAATPTLSPSPVLAPGAPVEIRFPLLDNGSGSIREFGVSFGTYKRSNPGTAELTLVMDTGNRITTKLVLSDLEDNQYKWFPLPPGRYVSGLLTALDGGGVSVWQVAQQGRSNSCVAVRADSGQTSYIQGCPGLSK